MINGYECRFALFPSPRSETKKSNIKQRRMASEIKMKTGNCKLTSKLNSWKTRNTTATKCLTTILVASISQILNVKMKIGNQFMIIKTTKTRTTLDDRHKFMMVLQKNSSLQQRVSMKITHYTTWIWTITSKFKISSAKSHLKTIKIKCIMSFIASSIQTCRQAKVCWSTITIILFSCSNVMTIAMIQISNVAIRNINLLNSMRTTLQNEKMFRQINMTERIQIWRPIYKIQKINIQKLQEPQVLLRTSLL